MIVLPLSRGSCRIKLSNKHAMVPRLKMVPDWCRSKCGARLGMPTRSTPPDLGLGSGAASLNFKPSNSAGTAAAWLQREDSPQAPATRVAPPPLRTSRRVHHVRGNCAPLIKFLLHLFGTEHGVVQSGVAHDLSNQTVSNLTTSYTPKYPA